MSVVRLSNDDCCAVDLMLERSQPGPQQGITNCFTAAPSNQMQERLTRVEKILHLLDSHPTGEPAQDLVARTLTRCDQQARVAATVPAAAQPSITAR